MLDHQRAICRECDSYFSVFWLDEYSEPKHPIYYCPYCGTKLPLDIKCL